MCDMGKEMSEGYCVTLADQENCESFRAAWMMKCSLGVACKKEHKAGSKVCMKSYYGASKAMMKGEGEYDINAVGDCVTERLYAHEECTGEMNDAFANAMEGLTEIKKEDVVAWAMENKDAKFVRKMKKWMSKKSKRESKRASRKAKWGSRNDKD